MNWGKCTKERGSKRQELQDKQPAVESHCLHVAPVRCVYVHICACTFFLPPIGLQCPRTPGGLCIFNRYCLWWLTPVFSWQQRNRKKQWKREREGQKERWKPVIYEKVFMCSRVFVSVFARMGVCLTVMTLCLWAVYLPQQHKAKMDDASLTHSCVCPHTDTLHHVSFILFLSFALITSLLYSPFHTCIHIHTHLVL